MAFEDNFQYPGEETFTKDEFEPRGFPPGEAIVLIGGISKAKEGSPDFIFHNYVLAINKETYGDKGAVLNSEQIQKIKLLRNHAGLITGFEFPENLVNAYVGYYFSMAGNMKWKRSNLITSLNIPCQKIVIEAVDGITKKRIWEDEKLIFDEPYKPKAGELNGQPIFKPDYSTVIGRVAKMDMRYPIIKGEKSKYPNKIYTEWYNKLTVPLEICSKISADYQKIRKAQKDSQGSSSSTPKEEIDF